MPLDDAHLQYPKRRPGMDHDRYAWSMLTDRRPVIWPGGKTLAVWVNVSLQHFPLDPVGKPVKLGYRSADADTKRIMQALMALLPEESRQAHEPTAEEIALALPPGYKGDLQHESLRRPGTD